MCLFVKKNLLWPGASQWKIYYHRMWGQLSTTCSNLLNQPNGELIVAVDQNQLWTMASETVDPIDWSHPPPLWAVSPERLVHSKNRCSSATTWFRSCNLETFSKRGNHLAYAATQGLSGFGTLYLCSCISWAITPPTSPTRTSSRCGIQTSRTSPPRTSSRSGNKPLQTPTSHQLQ